MIKVFSFTFISVIILGCGSKNIDLSLSHKILNKGLEQTNHLINEELNLIENSFANGIELEKSNIYNQIKESSNNIDSISNSFFNAPQKIKLNIAVIKKLYSSHINLLLNLTNSDARTENDYLNSAFRSIIEDKVGYHKLQSSIVNLDLANQIDSALSTEQDELNKLNLKIIYSQIKKAELKTYSCISTYLQGFGIKSHKFEGFVKVDQNSLKDSLTGTIIIGTIPTYSVNKFHFGQIDTSIIKGNNKYFHFPPAYKHKVPLIGNYKTVLPIDGNKFKIVKGAPIKGVIEIRHSKGTTYIPFEE